jgi:Protein of unknown function (DUF2628)
MAYFTILEAPDGDPERTVLIKDGFSVAALIFTVFWALWHRLWVVSAILFAILVCIELGADWFGVNNFIESLIQAAVGLIFAFEARSLWLQSLRRSGFRIAGIVEGTSVEAAELKYFMGRKRRVQVAAVRKFQMSPEDTLGLFGAH